MSITLPMRFFVGGVLINPLSAIRSFNLSSLSGTLLSLIALSGGHLPHAVFAVIVCYSYRKKE